jgi:hypothetical protein
MAKDARSSRALKRNVFSTVLLAAIIYAGLHFLVRTEGVQSEVVNRLADWAKEPVSLGRCSLTPLLKLRLEGLALEHAKVEEARIGVDPFALFSEERPLFRSIHIVGLEVTLRRVGGAGVWRPEILHGIGSKVGSVLGVVSGIVPDAQALPGVPERFINGDTIWTVERAKMVWKEANGVELAYLADVDSSTKVVDFSDRRARQTLIDAGHVKLASSHLIRDLELEVVQIGGYAPTLVLTMSDSAGRYDGFQTERFWEELRLRLEKLATL